MISNTFLTVPSPNNRQDWTKLSRGLGPIVTYLDPTKEQVIRSLMPWGFRELGLNLVVPNTGKGPGEPPLDFVGGTTSRTEWFVFWAFTKLLGPPGTVWTYQESYAGGRHVPGGAVVDFVLYMPKFRILVRVQTWQFHFSDGAEKVQADKEQRIALPGPFGEEIVIDVYEQYFIQDETGDAVLEVCKDAIAGIEWPNPMATGLAGDW